jgi:hypothetical protein
MNQYDYRIDRDFSKNFMQLSLMFELGSLFHDSREMPFLQD